MTKVVAKMLFMICVFLGVAAAQGPELASANSNKFKELDFLIGDWTPTAMGKATGGAFSFNFELNGHVMVRHSFAEYGKGSRHDDVLYIFRETPSDSLRAIYFDSEGHVIHYGVTTSANVVTFESDASPGMRFRISYQLVGKELKGKFDMMPPGSREYAPFLSWTAVKK